MQLELPAKLSGLNNTSISFHKMLGRYSEQVLFWAGRQIFLLGTLEHWPDAQKHHHILALYSQVQCVMNWGRLCLDKSWLSKRQRMFVTQRQTNMHANR